MKWNFHPVLNHLLLVKTGLINVLQYIGSKGDGNELDDGIGNCVSNCLESMGEKRISYTVISKGIACILHFPLHHRLHWKSCWKLLGFFILLSDILSETMQLWIGGSLIFLYACFLAIKGWRTGSNLKNSS